MAKIPRSGVDVSIEYGKVAGLYRAGGKAFAERAVRPTRDSAEAAKKAICELLFDVTGEQPEIAQVEALFKMGCTVLRAVRDVRTAWGRNRTSDTPIDDIGANLRHTVALLKCLSASAVGVVSCMKLGPEAAPDLAFAKVVEIVSGKSGQEIAGMDPYEVDSLRSDVLGRFVAALVVSAPPEGPPCQRHEWAQRYGTAAQLVAEHQAQNLAAMLGTSIQSDPLRLTERQCLDDGTWENAAAAENVILDARPLLDFLIDAMRTSDVKKLLAQLSTADWPGAQRDNLHQRLETLSSAVTLALSTLNVSGRQGDFLGLLPSPTRVLAWGCVEALAGIGFPPEPEGASKRRVSRKNPKRYVYGFLVWQLSGIFGSLVAHESEADPVEAAVRSDEAQAAAKEYASRRAHPGGLAAALGYRWTAKGTTATPSEGPPAMKPMWAKVWAEKDWGGKG